MSRRLLFVGLEGAEAGLVSQGIDDGWLPSLARLVEQGVWGPLVARAPEVRAMQWTTLATGRRAPHHGVCGDIEVREDGAGVRPASHGSWRAEPMWEALERHGRRCTVIGWPATAPATSWDAGTVVDDTFAVPFGFAFDAWPVLPDCIRPDSLRESLRDLRVHPNDITAEQLVTLVPNAAQVDQDSDARLALLAVALARSATVHAVATALAPRSDWECMVVAYPLLADVQREFMRYRAPRLPDVGDDDHAIFGEIVDHGYRVQDAMLGVLQRLAGDDVDVFVVSPYGFATGADRPTQALARSLPAAVAWHRRTGWLAARGAGIAGDKLVHGASVEDVAVTVLARFGLDAGAADGRVIKALAPDVGVRASVGNIADEGDAAPPPSMEPENDDTLAEEQRQAIRQVRHAWCLNAAEAHLAAGDHAGAARQYETVLAMAPEDWIAKSRLARCRLHLGDLDGCLELALEVAGSHPSLPWGHLLSAAALVLRGEGSQAVPHLVRARDAGGGAPNVGLRVGALHLVRNAAGDAEACFREVLVRVPDSAEALDGLGCALHAQGRHDDAIETLRASLGRRFHAPMTHVHLGIALAAAGRHAEAAAAADQAAAQDPHAPGLQALRERIDAPPTAQLVRR